MGWFSDLIERIDKRIDRPADQTVLTNPRRRRSLRIIDQMKEQDRRAEAGEPLDDDPAKVRGGASEKNARQRWLGG